jgi:hypothetical protein
VHVLGLREGSTENSAVAELVRHPPDALARSEGKARPGVAHPGWPRAPKLQRSQSPGS